MIVFVETPYVSIFFFFFFWKSLPVFLVWEWARELPSGPTPGLEPVRPGTPMHLCTPGSPLT